MSHNDLTPPAYDHRYLQGIEYFNTCDFFEAHEVWEELWQECQGASRTFYQGLIQAAVCLHHFGNGNVRGARKLYESSSRYLREHEPRHEGLDVTKFLQEMTECCRDIVESQEEFPQIEIVVEKIPEIHLLPPDTGA
ncbi:MAG: DUF309 domain-containing protein [Pirellulaceae bacterium]|nr:DUF309 domain-containing protein [Planctomycetales bacterium]